MNMEMGERAVHFIEAVSKFEKEGKSSAHDTLALSNFVRATAVPGFEETTQQALTKIVYADARSESENLQDVRRLSALFFEF